MNETRHLELARKDPKAFRYFYDAYYKEVFLFIYRRTDDESLSADISQQVFLKAMQNLHQYKDRGLTMLSWLLRIALNELAQHFRDSKKMRVVCVEQTGIEEIWDADDAQLIEKREVVFNTLKSLPSDDLEMIEMRFFEKRSFKEIGEIKNITENHAKIKLHRLLDKIRKKLPVEQ